MAAEPSPSSPSPTGLGLVLALVLVATKAVHWGLPWASPYGWYPWLRDVAVSSHADVLFAAGFALLAAALFRATGHRPRPRRVIAIVLLSLAAFCALYAVASIQIFDYLRSPLTYPLLYLAGDMGAMASSIRSFATPLVVGGMVAVPLAYVALVRLWDRAGRNGRAFRFASVALGLVAAVWGYAGRATATGRWSDRADVLIAKNPHWEFLSSVAREMSGGHGGPMMKDEFPPEFLADFAPEHREPAAIRAHVSGSPDRPRPRNLVLIVLESTGAQYLSLYGAPYPTTPHLEAEAKQALVFDAFYANAGFTANALTAMSLSIYPYMTWREYTKEYPDFPGETVAQRLAAEGYRTGFVTSGYLDYVGQGRFLQNRGYEEIVDWNGVGGEPTTSWGGDDRELMDAGLGWIDRDAARPFHLVLWTQQSHHPYEPAADQPITDFFAGRPLPPDDYDLGRYLNTLAEADRQLGRFFAGLRERGLDDDTIVVVTGDHGEAFGDPHATWGHGFRLYDEGLRVPLMIWSPALFPEGRRVATVGGHVDLNPTLTDLLGVAPSPAWEGHSLFDPKRPPRAYFYAANHDYLLGVREGDIKYIYNATTGRDEMYDLAADPREQVNVAERHKDKCGVLRQRLAAWRHHAAGRLAEARQGPVSGSRAEPERTSAR